MPSECRLYGSSARTRIRFRQLPRGGTTADIAEAALYLASDRSAYVTGIVMAIDGGTTAGSTVNLGRLAQFQAPPA
jgi:NAD(P)-dependent dehydrogenase (short-subunit alcohol dehydrogenase family)